jgi:SulP family sulfate permease
MDESLYFANAAYLEENVFAQVAQDQDVRHVILMCSAVNDIDLSALEALETINVGLEELSISLHLSEIKTPVMTTLKRSDFLTHLTGEIFDTQFEAYGTLRARELTS